MIEDADIELPDDVKRQLIRCEGFIDLKMADRAEQELREVEERYRGSFEYQCMYVNLLMLREEWGDAHDVINLLRSARPELPGLWIQEAYALRRAEDAIEPARELLEEALDQFPNESLIHYNLACYACRLGNLEEARQRLKDSADIEERWLKKALDDEDLEPLHEEIEEWLCS